MQSVDRTDPLTADRLDRLLGAAGSAEDESVLRTTTGARGVVLCRSSDTPAIATSTGPNRLADLCLDLAPEHAFAHRAVADEGDAQVLALLAADPLAEPSRAAACVLRTPPPLPTPTSSRGSTPSSPTARPRPAPAV